MPKLSRWFIKIGLVYFVFAFVVAVLLKAQSLLHLPAIFATLQPVYFHVFMVGWVTQMIMGVSYWFFPRYSKEKFRGNEIIGWFSFHFLNLGLLMRVVSEPLLLFYPGSFWRWIVVSAAVAQWIAGLFYVALIWNRVKEKP